MSSGIASRAALMVSARTLSKVLVVVSVIVTQNALGADRYGEFATIVVFSNIAGIVSDLGLQVVFVREASRSRERLGEFLAVTLAMKIPLGLAGGGALLCMTALFSPSLLPLVPVTWLLFLVSGLANLLRSCFFATGELMREVWAIALETVVLLAATVTFALTHQGVAAYIWAYTLSYGSTVVYAAWVVHHRYARLGLLWNTTVLWPLLRSGLAFAVTFVLTTTYFKIDVVILQALRGFAQVGYYNAAVKFIEGIAFVPQAVMAAIFPTLSVIHREGREAMRAAYTNAYRLLLAMGAPTAVAMVVLADAIVHYTHALAPAAPSLRILSISVVLLFVVNSFIYVLGAMDRQLTFGILTGLSLVVNVALNFAVIPLFPHDQGYWACSWTTVITEAFLLVAGYVALSRELGLLPWLRPALPVVGSAAAMAVVMVLLVRIPLLSAVAGAVVYGGCAWVTGAVPRDELRAMLQRLRRGGGAAAPVPGAENELLG